MKKRLLITSIVMMLVVAVALSTATYAWFTSNGNVTASSVSLTASTNNAPSIGIAWTNTTYGTEISATGPGAVTFDPMVPSVPTETTLSTSTVISAAGANGGVDFYSATIKDSPAKFNDDVKYWSAESADDQVAPYVWTNGAQTSFFLKNLSDTYNLGHVTLTATFTGEGKDLIRVAVFARIGSTANTAPTGNFTLKQILVDDPYVYTAATEYDSLARYYTAAGVEIEGITSGETLASYNAVSEQQAYTREARGTAYTVNGFAKNNVVADKIAYNTTNNAKSIDLGGLNANCIAELIVYVWTDGAALVDNRGGQAANIALDITATR